MVIKTKKIEIYEVIYDGQTWFLQVENELDIGETYYSVLDDEKVEVEDDDLFNEIVDYYEHQTGTSHEDDFDWDNDDEVDSWDESYI